jgi:hypothetical protein
MIPADTSMNFNGTVIQPEEDHTDTFVIEFDYPPVIYDNTKDLKLTVDGSETDANGIKYYKEIQCLDNYLIIKTNQMIYCGDHKDTVVVLNLDKNLVRLKVNNPQAHFMASLSYTFNVPFIPNYVSHTSTDIGSGLVSQNLNIKVLPLGYYKGYSNESGVASIAENLSINCLPLGYYSVLSEDSGVATITQDLTCIALLVNDSPI